MTPHIDRVGDRFEKNNTIVEIVEVGFHTEWIILSAEEWSSWEAGETYGSPVNEGWEHAGWKYLGNFNKSKNFNSLYGKLKGVQEGR